MFGLSYLSTDDKRLLEKLQDRLSRSTDPRIRNETEVDINTLMSKAKPYTECNLEEANELLRQLNEKMNTVSRLGKAGSVQAFALHIKDVNFYIQTLQMQAVLDSQARKVSPDHPPNLKDKPKSLNDLKKDRQRAIFGNTRWTIDMEEEDDDE